MAQVHVDAQGRTVLPRAVRDEIVSTPGEVLICRNADGLLLTPVTTEGTVEVGDDGLPVLDLGRQVTNDEVLAALDRALAER